MVGRADQIRGEDREPLTQSKLRRCGGRWRRARLDRFLVDGGGVMVDTFRHFHPTERKGLRSGARWRLPGLAKQAPEGGPMAA